ncbi:MAG: YbjQ family protein [Clostridia bacterium]|nr:YbjQ family protein [Clostridia bacterium]
MLLTTSDLRTEYQVLGLVKGSSMRAVHLGKDILAALRKLVGGNVTEYAQLLEDARNEALAKMIQEAESLGANAIICIRFATSTITTGAAEMIAYGTAVKI